MHLHHSRRTPVSKAALVVVGILVVVALSSWTVSNDNISSSSTNEAAFATSQEPLVVASDAIVDMRPLVVEAPTLPTKRPTARPTETPTDSPSPKPTHSPTTPPVPTKRPTLEPSVRPTLVPTARGVKRARPTRRPTVQPTAFPTPDVPSVFGDNIPSKFRLLVSVVMEHTIFNGRVFVRNLMDNLDSDTAIVVHLSKEIMDKYAAEYAYLEDMDRFILNPEHVDTAPMSTSVIFAHMSNYKFGRRMLQAAGAMLPTHFATLAHDQLLIRKGLEKHIFKVGLSAPLEIREHLVRSPHISKEVSKKIMGYNENDFERAASSSGLLGGFGYLENFFAPAFMLDRFIRDIMNDADLPNYLPNNKKTRKRAAETYVLQSFILKRYKPLVYENLRNHGPGVHTALNINFGNKLNALKISKHFIKANGPEPETATLQQYLTKKFDNINSKGSLHVLNSAKNDCTKQMFINYFKEKTYPYPLQIGCKFFWNVGEQITGRWSEMYSYKSRASGTNFSPYLQEYKIMTGTQTDISPETYVQRLCYGDCSFLKFEM